MARKKKEPKVEKVFKKQCDMQELYDRLYKKL